MKPCDFPETNTTYGPPEGYDLSQVQRIKAFRSTIDQGNLEGDPIIITCWEFTDEELKEILLNKRVFICFLTSGLPPHCLAPTFKEIFQ